jgi:diadenosine tetraphosphate (Ap4A) HIT family hydrolase
MSELPLPAPKVRRRRLPTLLGARRYVARGRSACFVCRIIERDPDYVQHLVHEDEESIVFLPNAMSMWGHVLVAPKAHREQVTGDFSADEYVRLQAVVHEVGEAVRRAVPCERLYVLSLGSQGLNRHVHWHVCPLPPGVPLRRQQLRAFSHLVAGALDLAPSDFERLAARIRVELERGQPAEDRPLA